MLGAADFGLAQVLEEEELEVADYPLPFELHVSFDWASRVYVVQGRLHKDAGNARYVLRLPGVEEETQLCWKNRRSGDSWPLEAIEFEVADNEALLVDHCYQVWLGGQLVFKGLVQGASRLLSARSGV